MGKRFKLKASEIKKLIEPMGSCIATDMITVEGNFIGYMYREPSTNKQDSGWRFFSGKESQDYVDDASNMSMYAVNTIANYDKKIIPLLNSSVGSAFERKSKWGSFKEIKE